ncbi:MAG: hypothetical protein J6A37_14430 [Oscillospiraceae bacterium]|nr:hypothetical protein [Oscillospiraceae bacterium]
MFEIVRNMFDDSDYSKIKSFSESGENFTRRVLYDCYLQYKNSSEQSNYYFVEIRENSELVYETEIRLKRDSDFNYIFEFNFKYNEEEYRLSFSTSYDFRKYTGSLNNISEGISIGFDESSNIIQLDIAKNKSKVKCFPMFLPFALKSDKLGLDLSIWCLSYIYKKINVMEFSKMLSARRDKEYIIPFISTGWFRVYDEYRYICRNSLETIRAGVKSNENEIIQMLSNLCSNPIYAMTFVYELFSLNKSFIIKRNVNDFNINLITKDAIQLKNVQDIIKPINNSGETEASGFIHKVYKESNIIPIKQFPQKVKDSFRNKRFKDYPVIVKSINYTGRYDDEEPKSKLSAKVLKKNLSANNSFIYINAVTKSNDILTISAVYDCEDVRFENIQRIIHEYILFLEDKINNEYNYKTDDNQLNNLHSEIHNELINETFRNYIKEIYEILDTWDKEDQKIYYQYVRYYDLYRLYKNNQDVLVKKDKSIRCASLERLLKDLYKDIAMRDDDYKEYELIIRNEDPNINMLLMLISKEYFEQRQLAQKQRIVCYKINYKKSREKFLEKIQSYPLMYLKALTVKFMNKTAIPVDYFEKMRVEATKIVKELKFKKDYRPKFTILMTALLSFEDFLTERYPECLEAYDRFKNYFIESYKTTFDDDQYETIPDEALVRHFYKFLMNCRSSADVNINEISPLYAKVENKKRSGFDSKYTNKLIGWYNQKEGEYWLIMDTKEYFMFDCFIEDLMRKGLYNDINPKTFISEQLGKNCIAKSRKAKANGYSYPRYDYTRTIDGVKYKIYVLYEKKLREYLSKP